MVFKTPQIKNGGSRTCKRAEASLLGGAESKTIPLQEYSIQICRIREQPCRENIEQLRLCERRHFSRDF